MGLFQQNFSILKNFHFILILKERSWCDRPKGHRRYNLSCVLYKGTCVFQTCRDTLSTTPFGLLPRWRDELLPCIPKCIPYRLPENFLLMLKKDFTFLTPSLSPSPVLHVSVSSTYHTSPLRLFILIFVTNTPWVLTQYYDFFIQGLSSVPRRDLRLPFVENRDYRSFGCHYKWTKIQVKNTYLKNNVILYVCLFVCLVGPVLSLNSAFHGLTY